LGLIDDLGRGPVAIDSVVFIYWIEEHTRFAPFLVPVFEAIDGGALAAVTSILTLLEVLVIPYRAGDVQLADRYEALLTRSRGLKLIDLDRSVLRAGAALRARSPATRTTDALQLATALAGSCKSFLTNDRELPAVPGLRTVMLSRYLDGQ
jgi:predicted nucleic acid-binding protein